MTTGGEGGMVTTNDESLWSKMWSLKDHGKDYDIVYSRNHSSGFKWLHETFGTNWRMMEMQATIGRIQLGYMFEWTKKRNNNADLIWQTCRKHEILRVPSFDSHGGHTVHGQYKCYVYVNQDKLARNWSRDRIVNEINLAGVPCYQGTCSEVYLEKAFDGTGLRPSQRLQIARELGETSLMFLVHPTLTEDEINKTCNTINNVLIKACR